MVSRVAPLRRGPSQVVSRVRTPTSSLALPVRNSESATRSGWGGYHSPHSTYERCAALMVDEEDPCLADKVGVARPRSSRPRALCHDTGRERRRVEAEWQHKVITLDVRSRPALSFQLKAAFVVVGVMTPGPQITMKRGGGGGGESVTTYIQGKTQPSQRSANRFLRRHRTRFLRPFIKSRAQHSGRY